MLQRSSAVQGLFREGHDIVQLLQMQASMTYIGSARCVKLYFNNEQWLFLLERLNEKVGMRRTSDMVFG